MIRKSFAFAIVLMLAAVVLYAQDSKKSTVKLTGHLIDNMCAGAHSGDEDFKEEAREHSTSCALMPGCAKSGFSVVAGDKVYKLDETGNKSALAVLKSTKTKKGISVEIEGTLEGDTLHVDRLAEVF
jgi:hypothetical protein